MPTLDPPFYPIIYVRGFAGNDSEIDDTVADPYMGFNLGSTKFRQTWTGAVRRHDFESPLVRLAKDFGYSDVYSAGANMPTGLQVSPKSVVIYRYYDEQFFDDLTGKQTDLNTVAGQRRDIEQFANGLGLLIIRLRDRICGDDQTARESFKVYLVAHSMGGLEKGQRHPLRVEGKRSCPPEDVGGIWGYAEFLEAIADPKHEQHDEYMEWAGEFDPEEFDAGMKTKAMRRGLPDWRQYPWKRERRKPT